jgi:hypothetical protein
MSGPIAGLNSRTLARLVALGELIVVILLFSLPVNISLTKPQWTVNPQSGMWIGALMVYARSMLSLRTL